MVYVRLETLRIAPERTRVAVRKQGVMSEHVGVWAASGRSLGLDGSWGSGRELGEGRRQVSVLRIRFPSLLQCVS